jgi:hypothetical protein
LGSSSVGRALWKAVDDAAFRRRLLMDPGNALAEEGFVLSDDEMRTMRGYWESVSGLSDRRAMEQLAAYARGYARDLY